MSSLLANGLFLCDKFLFVFFTHDDDGIAFESFFELNFHSTFLNRLIGARDLNLIYEDFGPIRVLLSHVFSHFFPLTRQQPSSSLQKHVVYFFVITISMTKDSIPIALPCRGPVFFGSSFAHPSRTHCDSSLLI